MDFKKITLCADDYSFTPAVSEAIIQLISRDRLSAVSCMTNTEHWKTHADWLKPYVDKVDIGLHFTLTDVPPHNSKLRESWPNGSPSHLNLMLQAYTRQLNPEWIRSEIKSQIDRFEQALGILPHFIDGHQHVHQLPIVRDALLAVYQENFPDASCYIRIPSNGVLKIKDSISTTIKSSLIAITGATSLKRLLSKHNIPFNTSFSGIYTFSNAPHYPQYFRQFLEEIKPNGLIMCHPGLHSEASIDSIAGPRWHEYNYLNSDAFLQDCENKGIQLVRFR